MPKMRESFRGDFADAGQALDGQRRQKCVDVFRLNDEEAVGLAPVGGDLGEEFVGRDSGGRGEMQLVADLAADGAGDLGCGGQAAFVFGHIEVGFVEGERLDEIGVAAEDVAGLARDGAVADEVRRHEDGVRAKALGAQGGHGGADAEAARFIRGGADDGAVAAPRDDDRLAAQLRIVALLDRGVKSVHVDVDDLANRHGRRVAGMGRPDPGARVTFRSRTYRGVPEADSFAPVCICWICCG